MKSLWILMLATCLAGPASAGIANIAWDECTGEGGTRLKSFACNVNTGQQRIVGSFVLDQPLADYVGMEAVVDGMAASSALPPWWQFFNAGSCRQISMFATSDFSVLPQTGCADPFQGYPGQGGLAAYCVMGANCVDAPTDTRRFRIKMAGAVADPLPVAAGVEYYAFILTIRNAKTVGTGACSGCLEPVCLRVNSIKAAGLSGTVEMNSGTGRPEERVGWQCGQWDPSGPPPHGDWWYLNCTLDVSCAATPVRNATWGQIKSLWR